MDGEEREELELQWVLEKHIRKAVDKADGLSFGYIGNYEKWGDNRKLIIWYGKEDKDEPRPTLWEHEAKDLDRVSCGIALASIKAYTKGYDSASGYWESMEAGTRIVCNNKVFCYVDDY
jgi:hypothetical protein|tara:strand:- start:112 stop:468 length:357 start_codon:yes stop_codon:yes gene_type:complete